LRLRTSLLLRLWWRWRLSHLRLWLRWCLPHLRLRLRLRSRLLLRLRLRWWLSHLRLRLALLTLPPPEFRLRRCLLRLSLPYLWLGLRLRLTRLLWLTLPHLRLRLSLLLRLSQPITFRLRLALRLWLLTLPHLRLRLALLWLTLPPLELGLTLQWLAVLWLTLPTLRLTLELPRVVATSARLPNRSCNPRQSCWRRTVRNHRTRRHRYGWPSPVLVEELLSVLRRITLYLDLRLHRRVALLMQHCNLRRAWLYLDAAAPAIEADAIHYPVVDHLIVDVNIARVHIMDDVDIYAIHCRVVPEVVMVPIAAIVSISGVSKPVVNAAVEPDVQSPESVMEAITPAVESPVAWSP
jgi:hypothetical protein